MAGGVSKATLPTMAGMVAALSGSFAAIYLNSTSKRHESELNEIIKREI
jgi:biopolymer transport protein ExbB